MGSFLEYIKWVLIISLASSGVVSLDALARWVGQTTIRLMTGTQQPALQQPATPVRPAQPLPGVPQG